MHTTYSSDKKKMISYLLNSVHMQNDVKPAAGSYWDGSAAALVVTGQLLPSSMPTSSPPENVSSSSNGNQAATDGAANSTAMSSSVVCRLTLKSTSMDLMSSVDNGRGAWLAHITRGALVEGFNSQSLPLSSVVPHLDAAVAPIKAAYAVAKQANLEDSGIVQDDATAPSVFEDVLAQEWRRLQAVVV